MSVSSLAAALDRRNVHYGWVIVGATLLVTVVTAAAMSTPGVLMAAAVTTVTSKVAPTITQP